MKNKRAIKLSKQDHEIISYILKQHTQRSLSSLLQKWQYFVVEVQRGYSSSIYDYTNALSIRDIIQSTINVISKNGQKEILGLLQEADDIFQTSTRQVQNPLLNYAINHENWWWYRFPKLHTDAIEEDVV